MTGQILLQYSQVMKSFTDGLPAFQWWRLKGTYMKPGDGITRIEIPYVHLPLFDNATGRGLMKDERICNGP